jgi:hypothetical protein
MDALAALKAMRAKPGRAELDAAVAGVTKSQSVTRAQTVTRGGRGKKVHASAAEKQKAYRGRKKAKG